MNCLICNGVLETYFGNEENPSYDREGDVVTAESVYWCPACCRLMKYYEVFKMTDSSFEVLELGT